MKFSRFILRSDKNKKYNFMEYNIRMCVVYVIFLFFLCLKRFEDSYINFESFVSRRQRTKRINTIYFLTSEVNGDKFLSTLQNFVHDNGVLQLVNETRFLGEVIAPKINHIVTLVEPRACRVFSRQTIGGGRIRRFYRFDDKTVGSPSPFYL